MAVQKCSETEEESTVDKKVEFRRQLSASFRVHFFHRIKRIEMSCCSKESSCRTGPG
jgi:hypothetical protein